MSGPRHLRPGHPGPVHARSDTPVGRYPASGRVVTENPDGTRQVDEPRSGRSWALGGHALFAASQFDGKRTYADIAELVRQRFGHSPTVESLVALEDRSLRLGLLEPVGGAGHRPGGRIVRAIVRPTLLEVRPAALIDRSWPLLRWLTSPAVVSGFLIAVTGIGAVILSRVAELLRELGVLLPHAGLIVLYCFAFVSAAFHEGAHVLACRRYEVPATFVAFGMMCLFPVAWTVPEQRTWNSLRLRHRLITIGAGPLGSLVFAALGAMMWLAGHRVEVLRVTGLLALSTGPAVMLPTLMPTFPGDAYLVLTELTGRSALRQSSLRYLTRAAGPARFRSPASPCDRTWWLSFGLATIASWIGGVLLLGWLIWHVRLAIM